MPAPMPDDRSAPLAEAVAEAAPAHFDAAAASLQAGAHAEAEAAFRALIAAAPGDWRGYAGASNSARQRGDYRASLAYYDDAAAYFPDYAMLSMERAVDLQALRRFDEADAAYLTVIAQAPDLHRARLGYGDCARQRGDRRLALARFREAAAARPDDPQSKLEIAYELRELGELDAAEAAFHEVLALATEPLAAVQGLAFCARRRNDPARALPWFRLAVALRPSSFPLRLELAADLRDLGQLDAAEAILLEGLAASPGHVPAFIALAVCARQRGDHAGAQHWFAQAADAEPAELRWQVEVATAQCEAGQAAAAQVALQQILAAVPAHLGALLASAHCARKLGDRQASLHWYQAAAAVDPGHLPVRLAIAADLRDLGQLEQAAAAFAHILETEPNNLEALQGAATCARRQGDAPAAISLLARAIAQAPADLFLPLDLAAAFREAGRLEGAEQIYRRLLQTAPGHAPAHIGFGQLARLRNDRPSALAHFIAAAAASPGDLAAGLEIAAEQREAGDFAAARATGAALLADHPGNPRALLSQGQTERQAGDHEAALAAFRAAHEAAPASGEPLVEIAVQLRLMGHQEQCDETLAKALEINPRFVPALLRLAEQAMIKGDAATGYELAMRAARIEPAEINAHLAAVECLARMANTGAAMDLLAALQARLGPVPAIIIKHLALLRQSGATRAALALARQAAGAAPHDFQLSVERFHCEMLAGDDAQLRASLQALQPASAHQRAAAQRLHAIFAESEFRFPAAITHYDQAAAENPHDPELQQSLARCRLMLFDPAGARHNLRRLFEINRSVNQLKNMRNISQHLYGEILEEFWLDAAASEPLQRLQHEPPAARITPAAHLVRDNPDSTAAAIGLMIALRQSNSFAGAPHTAGSAAPIPKSIVQYWDEETMPADVAALMRSWPAHNPDHAYRSFSDASARAYLRMNFPPPVLLAYQRGAGATQKSDIFRLAYAAREGGIYADADDRCLAPLASIMPVNAELLLCLDNLCAVGNNFFAARPRHPVLVQALHLAVEAINRGDHDSVWLATGPGLLTRVLATHIAQTLQQRAALPCGLTVLDPRHLRDTVATHCTPAYKFSNRHWLNAAAKQRDPEKAQ